MSLLRHQVFLFKESLPSEVIIKYKLRSIENITEDLMEFSAWDRSQPVATVVLVLKEGSIDQCITNVLGESDVKRVDARTIFGDEYRGEDHQIKIGKVELQKFRFRGSLVSDWMGPQEFPHSVQRPSTTQPGTWRDIEPSRVEADGGNALWLRAILQPWTSLKLRLTIGVFAAKDVTRVQDSNHPRFPFVNLQVTSISLLPFPPENHSVCLPFIPYLIEDNEDDQDEAGVPGWNSVVRAVVGLFRGNSAPHSKSNMGNLKEALKGDWKTEKRSKYAYPEIELEEETEDTENIEGKQKPNE